MRWWKMTTIRPFNNRVIHLRYCIPIDASALLYPLRYCIPNDAPTLTLLYLLEFTVYFVEWSSLLNLVYRFRVRRAGFAFRALFELFFNRLEWSTHIHYEFTSYILDTV